MVKVLILDGSHCLYRSWYAVPPMSSEDGRPTNAVHGFLAILSRAIDEFQPDQVLVAWDRGKPAYRKEALEKYKADRPPMDPAMKAQFPLIHGVLEAMGLPQLSVDGWEADDVLGSLTRLVAEAGGETVVLSGDKDLLQLVDASTIQARPANGGGFNLYDEAAVEAEFGIPPCCYVDFVALKGDPSDGIPGVTGIGAKGAAKLIAEYRSLENLLAHADEVPGRNGQLLREQDAQARMSKDVALIRRDLEVDFDPELRWGDFDPAAKEAFLDLGLTTMWRRLSKHARGHVPAEARTQTPPEDGYGGMPSLF